MAYETGVPEPRHVPKTDPNPSRRVLGAAIPERPQADDDVDGIEIDNAIERPQEGQPRQPGAKAH